MSPVTGDRCEDENEVVIILTRETGSNAKLQDAVLEGIHRRDAELGQKIAVRFLEAPAVCFRPLPIERKLLEGADGQRCFSWVCLTSPEAARQFCRALTADPGLFLASLLGGTTGRPSGDDETATAIKHVEAARIACVGEATAEALQVAVETIFSTSAAGNEDGSANSAPPTPAQRQEKVEKQLQKVKQWAETHSADCFIPPTANAKALGKTLPIRGQKEPVDGEGSAHFPKNVNRVLLPCSSEQRPDLAQGLTSRGFAVVSLATYATGAVESPPSEVVESGCLYGGPTHTVVPKSTRPTCLWTFASPSAAQACSRWCEQGTDLQTGSVQAAACIGETTAEACRRFFPHAEVFCPDDSPGVGPWAETIIAWLANTTKYDKEQRTGGCSAGTRTVVESDGVPSAQMRKLSCDAELQRHGNVDS